MAMILLALLFRLTQYAMLHQFLSPPLFGLGLELPFRLFRFLHLDDLLVHSPFGSIAFTVILSGMAAACFFFPEKNYLFPVFSILFFLYFLGYDTLMIHHIHPLAAMVWITVPFWARKLENRWLLWDAMRYYACYIYAASFIFKIIGGSLFVWQNGENSVKVNVAHYLYQFPDVFAAKILSFSIAHPAILNAGHLFTMIIEGLMIIGFFTKKYDRWLLWIPIIVHLSTYIFSDVYFFEFLVLIFLFFDEKQVAWIQRKIPVLAK